MSLKIIQSILILVTVLQGVRSQTQNDFINCTYSDPYNYRCNLLINNTQGLNDFEDIPGDHIENRTDADVLYVNCQYNLKSTNVPSIVCQKYKNLINIQYYFVGIERIDSYSFEGCENLLNLYLYYNQISTIDEQAFANNRKLQYLDLSQNRISTLPDNLFLNQQKLKDLNLNGNQLLEISENAFNPLTNLTSLYLSQNNIQKFKAGCFESLENLVNLDLSNLNLTEEFPKNLFKSLTNLNYIGLRSSKIKVIHADTFGELLSIQSIALGWNRIYAIDEKFIDNTGPSYLEMTGNICADNSINDNSMARKQMKEALKDCFGFYKLLVDQNPSTTELPITTTESSIATTGNTSTTSSSLNEKIQTIEDEVRNLTKVNEEIIENWKNQFAVAAENKEQIIKLQALSTDLKNEMDELKESVDEIKGDVQGKDLTSHNSGNNFVSINFEGNYQKHGSD